VELLTEPVEWAQAGHPRRAGVSSFGISGTNAHVILEQPPVVVDATPAEDSPVRATGVVPVVVSGTSPDALRAQAARVAAFVEERPGVSVVDVGLSLATTRSAFEYRAAVLAQDVADVVSGLTALAEGIPAAGVVEGRDTGRNRVAVVFSGQGAQRAGMGCGLYERFPVFARAWDAVVAELDPLLDRPLREVVFAEPGSCESELLEQTGFAQPALFALQVASFRLAESWGVPADVLVGHSIGEIAAAHVAGVLSLQDACTLVGARARLMQALPVGGVMVSVQATEVDVAPLLAGREHEVSIAAVNGPASVVLSGVEGTVLQIAEQLAGQGVKTRRLPVSHAFHSPLMRPMLDEFTTVVQGLRFEPARLPIVSTVTGEADTDLAAPAYWVRHVHQPVRFAEAIRTLRKQGTTGYLELGPNGVTTAMTQDTLAGTGAVAVSLLRGDGDEPGAAAHAVGHLHAHGVPVDWPAFFAGTNARRVALPTYAFQRERFWPDGTLPGDGRVGEGEATGVDAAFWSAVETQDMASLATALQVEGESLSQVLRALSSWRKAQREKSLVDSWRYRVTWKALPTPAAAEPVGEWLVLLPAASAGDAWVATVLDAVGTGAVPVEVTGAGRAEFTERIRQQGDRSWTGVLSLVAVEGPDLLGESQATPMGESSGVAAEVALTLSVLQALGDAGVTAPLWCVTRGAVSMGRMEQVLSPAQAGVWALGRVAALEYPHRWGGLVDLPSVLDERVTTRLRTVLAGRAVEDQVAVRASGLFARRLSHAPATAGQPAWQPRGTILITGGTGALGARAARWLARHGVDRLVLTSRRGPDAPGATQLRAELTALGVEVTVVACDVADREALAAVLASHPPTGVVHTAGISRASVIDQLSTAELAEVMAAKVTGAANLDELLGDRDLDCFVLFSSISAVWGSGGQGAYAVANAYLDALAERRHARGLAATSVSWGAWAEGGMASADAHDYLSRRGVLAMAPEPALTALWRAVANKEVTATIADIAWDQFVPTFTAVRPSPLLGDLPEVRGLIEAAKTSQDDGEVVASALRERLRGLPEPERAEVLLGLVRQQVAAVLRHSGGRAVDADRAFRDLGFDSVLAVELRTGLSAATGLSLSAGMVFDHPTPRALAGHLLTQLAVAGEPGVGELLDLLDRLSTGISMLNGDVLGHNRIVRRIQGLLAELDSPRVPASKSTLAAKLGEATDAELFELLDNDLGLS
jgi:acyl transferase domain-containing protein